MIDVFEQTGFRDVAITHRYDSFVGTSKERTAKKYGVIGVNVSATRI
jgi:hypothetical protein